MTVHHPGHCKLCGEPTHVIPVQYPIGHRLAGRPMRLGPALSGVVTASLLLTDGSTAPITVHRVCAESCNGERLAQLWRDVLEGFRFESDNRDILGAKPLNRQQQITIDEQMLRLADVVPLGVLCWTGIAA